MLMYHLVHCSLGRKEEKMGLPARQPAVGHPSSGLIASKLLKDNVVAPVEPNSADLPPIIRTEAGLQALQDILDQPPRDMPKLRTLLENPSPFTEE